MEGKCYLCNWDLGRLHNHHIIPKSVYGKNTNKNKVLLCPNHHTEAHIIGYEEFNRKYNFVGEEYSDKELININNAALFYYKIISSPNPEEFIINNKNEVNELLTFMEKEDLDEHDLMAHIMGITRNQILNYVN